MGKLKKEIIIKEQDIKHIIKKNGEVYLELPRVQYKKRRLIGFINFDKKEFIKTYRQIHIFKKTDSIGYPFWLLAFLTKRQYINSLVLDFGDKRVKREITVEELKKKRQFLNYKKKGYELQIFFKINEFKEV